MNVPKEDVTSWVNEFEFKDAEEEPQRLGHQPTRE